MNWNSPASCTTHSGGCFCEQPVDGLIKQPSDTYSAIGFLVVAFLVIARRNRTFLTWMYAIALLLVGLGTAYYHASLTFLGQVIDFGGMNLVILIAPFFYWSLARQKQKVLAGIGYVAAFLASLAILIWVPDIRRGVFAVLIAVVLGLYTLDPARLVPKEQKSWLWWGLGIFLTGYLTWNLDSYKIFCWPTSWLQGHAFWHLTSAAAAYCLFRLIEPKKSS